MRRSKKTNFRKSAKTKQFSLQQKQMKGIKYSISTEDVGWKKPLQCRKIIKIEEILSEYLAQKHEKSEFSNNF